jgi:hypothetical protein
MLVHEAVPRRLRLGDGRSVQRVRARALVMMKRRTEITGRLLSGEEFAELFDRFCRRIVGVSGSEYEQRRASGETFPQRACPDLDAMLGFVQTLRTRDAGKVPL